MIDGRWGYIDTRGKLKFEPKFEHALSFADGFAVIELNGKYGYIDTDGKMLELK